MLTCQILTGNHPIKALLSRSCINCLQRLKREENQKIKKNFLFRSLHPSSFYHDLWDDLWCQESSSSCHDHTRALLPSAPRHLPCNYGRWLGPQFLWRKISSNYACGKLAWRLAAWREVPGSTLLSACTQGKKAAEMEKRGQLFISEQLIFSWRRRTTTAPSMS